MLGGITYLKKGLSFKIVMKEWGMRRAEIKELIQVTLRRFHDTWSSVPCISCVPMRCGAGGRNVPFRKLVLIANLRKESIIFLMLYADLSIVNFPLSKSSHSFPEIDAGNYPGRAGLFASPIIMQI